MAQSSPLARDDDHRETVLPLASGAALHIEGSAQAPPVLFLHGVGGGAWSWRPQRRDLATEARLFVWEARGHGDAARVADAGLADYYTDAKEALAAVVAQTGRPAFIAGHSMGGLLAIALASDAAPNVAGLFLIDPVYASGEDDAYGHFPPAAGRVARTLFEPVLRSFDRNGAMSRQIARWMFTAAFEDHAKMEIAWLDQRTQIPIEYPRMLRESFVRPIGFELRDFAREITAPTFLLEGTGHGGRARFPQLAVTLAERLGTHFERETIAGGHYLQLDRPDAVNERLRRFIETYASLRTPPDESGVTPSP